MLVDSCHADTNADQEGCQEEQTCNSDDFSFAVVEVPTVTVIDSGSSSSSSSSSRCSTPLLTTEKSIN